ncbi:MAG: tungstate ABC transporter substrate-binding protein WtpA [Euryarchaeota archaeon]|nr:tungstate ABC transporter substrate-binding protein WtpA [Euryarchaeota archaeon]
MMKSIYILVIVVIAAVIVAATYLPHEQEKTELKVVYAGSLIVPFGEIEEQFESTHPGVDVQMEGHGSIQAVRQVTDIHRNVDVLVVADENLIPDMMYPDHADWCVRFATNQMVIAYTNNSRYAGEINDSNWYEILARPDVTFGFSNPMLDACGYRILMVTELAEHYYGDQTIFDDLIASNIDPEFTVTTDGDTTFVVVPETLDPRTEKIVIRGGSVQLLALLDFGEIDYAFLYKSVAEQHRLRYLELPAEIDMSSPEYEDDYKKVTIQLGFQRFTSVGAKRECKPIFYGITIPKNAASPELAAEFVEFVISDEGLGVLRVMEQSTVSHVADNPDKMPDILRSVVVDEIDV